MTTPGAPELVLGTELGRGAHTVVYQASRNGHAYAVKVLHRLPTDAEGAARAFRREAALLAGIEHPALVPRHEVGERDGRPYLVMDLVEGRTLERELVARGTLPLEQVLLLGQQLAEALHAAHRVGLTHRDVKPANVMIGRDGRPRLIDFGLAGDSAGLDVTGDELSGTVGYAPPEQCGVLARPVDARSDLYSLGVVLYECLTGRPPFVSAEIGELVRLHAFTLAPDVRGLRLDAPAPLAQVVATLLAKDPDDRYQSAAGLAADLGALLADDLGAAALRGRTVPQVVPLSDLPLLGRASELTALTSHWLRAHAGAGGIVAVTGAPGSGRTRLLAAVAETAETGPGTVLRLSADGTSGPGGALRRGLDLWAAEVDGLAPAARDVAFELVREAAVGLEVVLAELSPALGQLLGLDVPGRTRPDQHPAAVATLLERMGHAAGGILLLVDDADQLDEVSGRLLRILAQLPETAGVFTLLTGASAAGTLPGVGSVVPLGGLLESEVATLVTTVLGGLPPGLAERLHTRTGGNPRAILEQLRAAVDAGLLTRSWGVWSADLVGLDALDLPADSLDLLLRRVSELNPLTRTVLTALAAAEASPSADLLARATGTDAGTVRAELARAAGRGLLEHRGARLALVDPRLATALVDDVSAGDRQDLHQRLGEAFDRTVDPALDRVSADPVEASARARLRAAALHLSRGHVTSDPARVIDRCTAAGSAAVADLSWNDAQELLETGRRIASETGLTEPAALSERLGEVHLAAGRTRDAERELRLALARTTGGVERARLLLLLANMHVTFFDHEASEAALDEAFAGLRSRWVPRWFPKPGAPFVLLVTGLALTVVAAFITVLGVGRGTAAGVRRDRHAVVTALCVAGNQNSVYSFRPLRGLCWQWRALYPAARTGPSPEYAMVYIGLGVTTRLFGLRRTSRNHFARARYAATHFGEAGAEATVEFYVAAAEHLADADDGGLDRVLRERAHQLPVSAYVDGLAIRLCQDLLAGRVQDARAWYERGRLRLAGQQIAGDSFMLFDLALTEALGTTDSRTQALLFDPPLSPSRGVSVNALLNRLYVYGERGDHGAGFDADCAAYEDLGISPRTLMPVQRQIYTVMAHGRCEQARAAEGQVHVARLAQAETAVHTLGKVARTPLEKAHVEAMRADLHQQRGDADAALDGVSATARLLRRLDAPVVEFEIARIAARALAQLGRAGRSRSYALTALEIAQDQGWTRRALWVRAEFGVSSSAPGSISSTHTTTSTVAVGRYRERFAALEQISRAASRVLDPTELVDVVLNETVRILGGERAFLFLVQDDGSLAYAQGRDADRGVLAAPTAYAATLVERVCETREPVVVTGTEDGIALGSQSVVAHGLRSILVAPLQLDGRVLGVVYVDSRVAQGIFTRDDAAVLLAVTTQVAASLETARAAQLAGAVLVAREQRDLAERLRASMERLSGSLVPGEVLTRLAGAARDLTGASVVQLTDTDGGLPDAMRSGGREDLPRPLEVAAAETGAGPVLSWLEVPLRTRGRQVGVLRLGSARPDGFAGTGGSELVAALVGQAVVAYDNAVLFTQVQRLATTDGLTGVTNRAHAVVVAETRLHEAVATSTPVSAVMLDIDHFKLVNDTHGHQVGDEVIRTVADRLRAALRADDLLARYGGEEFVVLLVDSPDASAVAERLRQAVRATPVPTSAGPLQVTISVGLAHYDGDTDTLDTLLGRSDAGMYDAKRAGRDRVGRV